MKEIATPYTFTFTPVYKNEVVEIVVDAAALIQWEKENNSKGDQKGDNLPIL